MFPSGEFVSALTHIEKSLAFYDPQLHRPDRSPSSTTDPKVVCLSYAARILWKLGYPDQARKRMNEALIVARELSHPFSLGFALGSASWVHKGLREVQIVQERTEALMTLGREHGFPLFWAWGANLQGWVLAEQGQEEEGTRQLRQRIAAYRATGAAPGAIILADLAYRLKGTLTLQQKRERATGNGQQEKDTDPRLLIPDPQAEAEECFLKAIEITRQQQAKSLELRASTSLARLWQQQGKNEEARQMLAEIYRWFTEGFDTKDLQEAKALLEELS